MTTDTDRYNQKSTLNQRLLAICGSTKEENILTRLRVMLNKTLKIINKHPTGLCGHCGTEESVEHVICVCQKYTNERQTMKNGLKMWEWIN